MDSAFGFARSSFGAAFFFFFVREGLAIMGGTLRSVAGARARGVLVGHLFDRYRCVRARLGGGGCLVGRGYLFSFASPI